MALITSGRAPFSVKMIWLKFDAETVNNMAQYFYRRNKPLAALQVCHGLLLQPLWRIPTAAVG